MLRGDILGDLFRSSTGTQLLRPLFVALPMRLHQVIVKLPRDLNHRLQVRKFECLLLELRHLPRRCDCVPDLSPIELVRRQLCQVVFEIVDVDALARLAVFRFGELAEPADEDAPDFAPVGLDEAGVVEGELDTGFEGFVKVADAVASEDEDALVVFEDAEEDFGRIVA